MSNNIFCKNLCMGSIPRHVSVKMQPFVTSICCNLQCRAVLQEFDKTVWRFFALIAFQMAACSHISLQNFFINIYYISISKAARGKHVSGGLKLFSLVKF